MVTLPVTQNNEVSSTGSPTGILVKYASIESFLNYIFFFFFFFFFSTLDLFIRVPSRASRVVSRFKSSRVIFRSFNLRCVYIRVKGKDKDLLI